jgi:hypothetical protein
MLDNSTLTILSLCIVLIALLLPGESEQYALPIPNQDLALVGRIARPSRCTDGCIVRTRGVTGIDIQCAEMCKNWYPVTYDTAFDCHDGWGGYSQSPCSSQRGVFMNQLEQSLMSPLAGMYTFGNN